MPCITIGRAPEGITLPFERSDIDLNNINQKNFQLKELYKLYHLKVINYGLRMVTKR